MQRAPTLASFGLQLSPEIETRAVFAGDLSFVMCARIRARERVSVKRGVAG